MEHILFDNYDNYLEESDWLVEETDWHVITDLLSELFEDKTVIAFGALGLWNGNFDCGKVGSFDELLPKMIKDCDYIKITDDKGHLCIKCSHHDGTNFFEVKELTEKGERYYENWQYSTDSRTERVCHTQLIKRYSHLPWAWEKGVCL